MPNWKIEKYTVLESGYGYEKNSFHTKTNLYVAYQDENSREEANRLINGILNNTSYKALVTENK